ncbi:MAG TPA: 7-cyano-7-deazaguanine synthase QueC [Planctomycetota bacterium]|nr:7-cyano-7-deazaguanine synthase QueC [Planctomycetota bacterium]
MKAVALLSGGLDSTVAFAIRARDTILALTVDYGQRASRREIASARKTAARYRVPHRVLRIPWLGGGALVDRSKRLPRPDLERPAQTRASAAAVWVPNRNGVFIAAAAALAERMGASRVVVGFNREEAATFPDNSAAFLAAANRALEYSTQRRVRVESPTLRWDKARIVREARRRRIPLGGLWPCYEGGRTWCRRCESCLRSLRAGVMP